MKTSQVRSRHHVQVFLVVDHSHSLPIWLTSTSSCFLVSKCFISSALTFEPVVPKNRLLSVLLSTLNLLAASETLGVSQERRNAVTSLIALMVVEILRLEVVLMMDCGGVHCSGVCTVPGNCWNINHLMLRESVESHFFSQQKPSTHFLLE
jgi:hypothetical protein